MSRSLQVLVVAALGLVLPACTQTSPQPDLTGQDVHLKIIHTADIHSRLFPYQFAPGQIDKSLGLVPSQGDIAIVGGAARLKTWIDGLRLSSDRTIHLDSGDIFEGAPIFNVYNGEAEMRAETLLGVNAMALGNHEFDKGPVDLELMKEKFGGFPILAANYEFADPSDPTQPKLRDIIQPYTIINAGGLRVGVVGMGNLSSLQGIYEGGNGLGVKPLDTLQTIKSTVAYLRPQVDLLIFITHLGLDVDESLAQANTMCQTGQLCTPATAAMDCVNGSYCSTQDDPNMGTCQYNVCDQNGLAAIKGVDVIFGGHLHIVLNPPNRIEHQKAGVDGNLMPDGYTVVCHSGAFAKYVGNLDLVVHVADPKKKFCGGGIASTKECTSDADCVGTNYRCEPDQSHVKTYTYQLEPITDATVPVGDAFMANMLEPYQAQMNLKLNLGENYAVVPCPAASGNCPKVLRNDPSHGDSQAGNLVATAMRLRKRVEADFGLTNSLGIRTDFESGPLDLEEMYNVFPFENTITTMFLSGNEIRDMLDFLAQKASERGCQSQAQVSGIWYVSDCSSTYPGFAAGQVSCGPFDILGKRADRCHPSDRLLPLDAPNCTSENPPGENKQCTVDKDCDPGLVCVNVGANANACLCRHDGTPLIGDDCLVHPEKCNVVLPFGSYRVAVNDYIANGGSGFLVLKQNTTKFNTGISLRDALLDYLRNLPDRCSLSDPLWSAKSLKGYFPPTQCRSNNDCNYGYPCDLDPKSLTFQTCAKSCNLDSECVGGGYVCDTDMADSGVASYHKCVYPYDYTKLPCLIPDGVQGAQQGHDGRIQMVAP